MGLSFFTRPSVKFLGPWELFEVLEQEFQHIDPTLPPRGGGSPWRVEAGDVLDENGVRRRIVELMLPRHLSTSPDTGWLPRVGATVRRVALRGLTIFRNQSLVLPHVESARNRGVRIDLGDSTGLAEVLHRAVGLPPVEMVELCRRYLSGERGAALCENIPDLDAVNPSDRSDVHYRFNRQVLEIAFGGMLRSTADRELAELFRRVHRHDREGPAEGGLLQSRWALCLSGGGVRSSTFCLGVVQELARRKLLRRFDYLSTVSGGGYIGSWLTAWMSRVGRRAVAEELGRDSRRPLDPEPSPVHHLRNFSNYLAPRRGLLSVDTWTLVATIVRNLLLNWMVILPFVAAVLVVPMFTATVVALHPQRSPIFIYGIEGLTLAGFVCASMGVWFVHTRRPGTGDEPRGCHGNSGTADPSEQADRRGGQGAFLLYCLTPIVLATVLLTTVWTWLYRSSPGDLAFFPAWLVWFLRKREVWLFPKERMLLLLVSFGTIAHLTGWLAGYPPKQKRAFLREMTAIIVTGAAVGGVMFVTAEGIESFSALLAGRLRGGAHGSVDSLPFRGDPYPPIYSLLAFPGFLASLVLAGFLYVGITSRRRSDEEREWSSRYSAWILIIALSWLSFSGIVVTSEVILSSMHHWAMPAGIIGGASGWLAALLGKSSKTSAGKKGSTVPVGFTALLSHYSLPVLALVSVVLILMTLAAIDKKFLDLLPEWSARFGLPTAPANAAALALTLLLVGSLASRLIDVNKFSLHAMYRARLIRTYLGASRSAGTRKPNPFTGFDPTDNINMHCLCDGVPHSLQPPPIHVLNLALNLTAGSKLAWQDRKARSFTVTPFFAGAYGLGYRRTRVAGLSKEAYYGGEEGLSLGTAMAISGAAASPNMGYHSSPAVTFLMALFNARLGWWLGNPGWAGRDRFNLANPSPRISPIFAEILGLTTDDAPLVYLSDGGHFENLGLYEMVLRRCKLIVVVDASCDPKYNFEDLGNAIRKIRVDFGIPIDFERDAFLIQSRDTSGKPAQEGQHLALGTVRYSVVDPGATDGFLVYAKPALTGDEPRDVLAYARTNKVFPHDTTADQFFGESQFESYRALGEHTAEKICDALLRHSEGDPLSSARSVSASGVS